jgi:hypothetical protein
MSGSTTAYAEAYAGAAAPRAWARAAMEIEAEALYPDYNYGRAGAATDRGMAGGTIETAVGAAAGDQFEFTIKNPVSLDRQMSSMLPLVEASIEARTLLIFSGANAGNRNHNPRLGAELVNTSGMKLPAGPITVYDGGTYAGDALIECWNEGEKRFISYGEDLSVTGTVIDSGARMTVSVTVSGGVMIINHSQEYIKTYNFKNNSQQIKQILVEHPKNYGTTLESPAADEETPAVYRFNFTLPAEDGFTVLVRETRPVVERISLIQLRQEAFLSYASSHEIPVRIREALRQAVILREAVNTAESAVIAAERQRGNFVSDQDRIRKNTEAAGNQTQQGQEYLRRLMTIDSHIDALDVDIVKLRETFRNAQKEYENYLGNLNL